MQLLSPSQQTFTTILTWSGNTEECFTVIELILANSRKSVTISVVYKIAVQCIILQGFLLQCSVMHHIAVQSYSSVQCNTVQCSVLQCVTVHLTCFSRQFIITANDMVGAIITAVQSSTVFIVQCSAVLQLRAIK